MKWQLYVVKAINRVYDISLKLMAFADKYLENYKLTLLPVIADDPYDVKYREFLVYPEYAKLHYYFKYETDISYAKFVEKMGNIKEIRTTEGILEVVDADGFVAINLISKDKNI